MEKDTAAAHRRHRLGPGAPPSTVGPGHLKAASEMAELQRSRSVGGLHQKGHPPSCIEKLCKEPESNDQDKDVRSNAEDASCQASPEEDKWEQRPDAPAKADDAGEPVPLKAKESSLEASGQEQQDRRESEDKHALGAEEQEPESIKLGDLLEKESCHGCLGTHTASSARLSLRAPASTVVPCTMKEEKRSQMDMGDLDLSEDEPWGCCVLDNRETQRRKQQFTHLPPLRMNNRIKISANLLAHLKRNTSLPTL
ncbi:uncharacterized protein C13orf46 homolog isoform X2 [Vicugna pacos]|uniref:Uncharacterized protein C13orf46 homolog isoform X2 n=1 Tax=Vicugna pacos TaxID=30538 RepID=A0ABM5EHT2_VICPA